ncbi:CCA tRNA nucleotidyltransferase [Roseibacillus ishigakijimensis]|uniref:CCA tRNA nucleotidyltransferase n=1 Tax=Roseibacillus ishigakijimensis TaxID=454146 RepID=A0A934RR16_9BACT|nr:CCA tRNA nucleotidyltransferase [Roseibacillus ishigakijimensis]MBK1833878.1 CCA tRNA nucleotidyltransferase [Roseibacillus ishigakijimensis]
MADLKQTARRVAHRLLEAGHETYFAGGCVRDQLLGQEPKDYDLATSATPDEVQALFKNTNAIGAHFGVILVKEKGHHLEVATFRHDGSYRDGRRPDSVTFTNAREDARRRDFTINGLFQHPLTGAIEDYVGGQEDLEKKVLRAIGDPAQRFQEDALRLLRAVRFAVRTGFTIEEVTWQAMQEHAPLLARISPERIRDEFSRILTDCHRAHGLQLLLDSGLLGHFLPEALPLVGCEQPPQWHPEGDVYNHTKIALDLLPDDAPLELCLGVLLHDIGKPPTYSWDEKDQRIRFSGHDAVGAEMSEEILRRLRYSNETIARVREMVARHMHFMHVQEMRTAKLKRFMARPTFPLELQLHKVDCESSNGFSDNYEFLRKKQEEFANEPIIPKPLVTGRDLIARGLQPGPEFGTILEEIQTRQLEGELKTREEGLRLLQQLLPSA